MTCLLGFSHSDQKSSSSLGNLAALNGGFAALNGDISSFYLFLLVLVKF